MMAAKDRSRGSARAASSFSGHAVKISEFPEAMNVKQHTVKTEQGMIVPKKVTKTPASFPKASALFCPHR